LLVIDPDAPGKFLKSNQPYSTLIAGVYSTKPGFVGRLQPPSTTRAHFIVRWQLLKEPRFLLKTGHGQPE